MSIEFNDINGNCDGHYRKWGCVCSCSDIGHIMKAEFFDDEPVDLEQGITFQYLYSTYRPWYKRMWDAAKYIFHSMFTMRYDSIMLHPKDARELHQFLGQYLECLDASNKNDEDDRKEEAKDN